MFYRLKSICASDLTTGLTFTPVAYALHNLFFKTHVMRTADNAVLLAIPGQGLVHSFRAAPCPLVQLVVGHFSGSYFLFWVSTRTSLHG